MTTTDRTITERAPAKINLTLHVTGKRQDGYHMLDSLVTFAEIGDVIEVAPADDLTLTIGGPFAQGLSATDNLVMRAAALFEGSHGAHITLTKNLPVASGIGGGSADAAATLRALSKLWNLPLPDRAAQLSLGADVPACVLGGLLRMRGIGDALDVMESHAPTIPMLLVNPRIAISTPQIFSALGQTDNPAMPDRIPDWTSDGFFDWLTQQHNDLEPVAIQLAPVINDVLAALKEAGGLARMSGSGATCFGIFQNERDMLKATETIASAHPDWWIAPAIT